MAIEIFSLLFFEHMEKDQPEKPIDKKNSKYNRAHFYDVFLGRPEQAEEIAEFVFWLHKHYNSPFKAKNSNNNNAKRNEVFNMNILIVYNFDTIFFNYLNGSYRSLPPTRFIRAFYRKKIEIYYFALFNTFRC
jgi:hypothetical protein